MAHARAALVATVSNLLDGELQQRASLLHANEAALRRQERDVARATEGLRAESDRLAREAKTYGKQIKELGHVQNWAEVLERDLLVLGETVRLANKRGSRRRRGGKGKGTGSDDDDDDDDQSSGSDSGDSDSDGGSGSWCSGSCCQSRTPSVGAASRREEERGQSSGAGDVGNAVLAEGGAGRTMSLSGPQPPHDADIDRATAMPDNPAAAAIATATNVLVESNPGLLRELSEAMETDVTAVQPALERMVLDEMVSNPSQQEPQQRKQHLQEALGSQEGMISPPPPLSSPPSSLPLHYDEHDDEREAVGGAALHTEGSSICCVGDDHHHRHHHHRPHINFPGRHDDDEDEETDDAFMLHHHSGGSSTATTTEDMGECSLTTTDTDTTHEHDEIEAASAVAAIATATAIPVGVGTGAGAVAPPDGVHGDGAGDGDGSLNEEEKEKETDKDK